MRVLITGVPGTGKTEVAKSFSNITSLDYISLTDLINKSMKTDIEDGEKAVDLKELQKLVSKYLGPRDNYVIEGHLGCEVVVPTDFVFVLRTSPDVLRKRLEPRKYSKKKIDENVEAEMLDYCTQRVEDVYHWKAPEVDTSKINPFQAAQKIAEAIRYDKKVIDTVNYSSELKKKLKLK